MNNTVRRSTSSSECRRREVRAASTGQSYPTAPPRRHYQTDPETSLVQQCILRGADRQTDRQTGEQHNDRCPLGRPRVNHDLTTAPSQPSHWLHHSLQSTWAAGRCLAAKWPGKTTTDTGNRSSVRRDRLVKQRRLETGDALCRLLVSSTTLSVARYALFVPFFCLLLAESR